MSKELAQTVGGKKIGLLFVLLAALAVFATVGSQWRSAKADLVLSPTIASSPASGNAPVGSTVTYTATAGQIIGSGVGSLAINLPAGVTIASSTCTTTATGGVATNVSPSSSCATSGTVTANGVVTLTVLATVNNAAVGTTIPGATATATQGASQTTAATTALAVSGGVTLTKSNNPTSLPLSGGTVTSTITFTNVGAAATSSFTLNDSITTAGLTIAAGAPAGLTNCQSANPTGWPGAAITTTASTVLSCDSAAVNGGASVVWNVTATVPASAGGQTVADSATTSAVTVNGVTVTPAAANASTAQSGAGNVELRHVNEAGNLVLGQDVFNNVRGARHTACLFTDPLGNNLESALTPYNLGVPLNLTNVQINGGGGFAAVGDVTPSFTNPIFFTGTSGDSNGASCLSWTSTAAGDQELSIVVTTGSFTSTFDWDTNNDGNANTNGNTVVASPSNASLIKEWNVLQTSSVTGAGTAVSGAGTNNVVYNTSRVLTLNPATGLNIIQATSLSDSFMGSHITRTGQPVGVLVNAVTPPATIGLVGVNWTVTLATPSTCGQLVLNNGIVGTSVAATATVGAGFSGVTTLATNGQVANEPSVSFVAGGLNCLPGGTAKIIFTGQEPGALGSGPGVTVTQTVNISFTQASQVKQVLLAWAGQRVVLEHDWRLPAGDQANGQPAPQSQCAFGTGSTTIRYIRSAGSPGNFITGLAATLSGNDQADVTLTGDNSQVNDAAADPQDSCISRVLYESEDPGEVDVEAFANSGNNTVVSSKVAFVVYYMKINTVSVSLVNQVSKPTHNSSVVSDYAPGNPWDASKDAANNTADWNVSRDLLVRGRVTGWFVNSNPSGRARDASNPQNVLPADRWVMPDDWVNIAGGSALAGAFRPSYDLMFAPNNTVGLALTSPSGSTAAQVTATITGSGVGSAASPLKVANPAVLPTGAQVTIGASTSVLTVTNTAGVITLSTALAAAPAAGTPVFIVTGVPFEGPYSLIDIPNFAALNGGIAGGALSNILGTTNSATRDTTQADGTIDWWDAPMPPAPVSVALRGTGFMKQVIKSDVYYLGTPNSTAQIYPNPYYIQNIPGSPYIPAVAAGGGYLWDSWGNDGPQAAGGLASSTPPGTAGNGPYTFWQPVLVGTNSAGAGDATLSAANQNELAAIRTAYGDSSIARDLVVYSDNHGEFMVTANGDFKTDLTACATNALAGGKLCKPGDKVGVASISAVADYPDFKKHFPVASNVATVNWTWAGYKNVTVEPGETDQFKYVVFHAIDRDGFCNAANTTSAGAVQLHPVLTSLDTASPVGGVSTILSHGAAGNQIETVDFLIDSGEGIILNANGSTSFGSGTNVNDGRQFATGVQTYSYLTQKAAGLQVFPLDASNAATGQTDECQAFIKVSNSLLGVLNVLTIAHDDEGNVGFDKVIDLTGTTSYTLNFRWSLITWAGADGIPVADALKGGATTKNPGGNDISAQVTAIYGWDQVAQAWLGFFPTGVNVPGANNLTALKTGSAYWIAITGPGPVTWTVTTNVGAS